MCIFCDIISGKIGCAKIYEDEKVLAFLDISQVTKGHTLLVPKHHCEHMLACDDETLAHMMIIAKTLGNHLLQVTQASGMNILSNVHEVAGQSVPHFHMHLIPRYGKEDSCCIVFHESAPQDIQVLATQYAYTFK